MEYQVSRQTTTVLYGAVVLSPLQTFLLKKRKKKSNKNKKEHLGLKILSRLGETMNLYRPESQLVLTVDRE